MSSATDSKDERYVRTERSANDYQDLTDTEHLYKIPDMYIGSIEPEEREEFLMSIIDNNASASSELEEAEDEDTEGVESVSKSESSEKSVKEPYSFSIQKGTTTLSRGIERLFLEIISNAGDNADASRRAKVDPGSIDVVMKDGWIKIRNGGVPVPVEPHPSYPEKMVPDIIFGKLRSSSNYDTKVIRMGCGRNGLGSKCTNIFSKVFIVKIGDPKNKLCYTGTWQNNMKEGPVTQLEPYKEKQGFVEIAWYLDFERFGLTEYPPEAMNLFARYTADFSFTCKVPVSFNGVVMNFSNVRDYAKLFVSESSISKCLIHREWPDHNKDNPNGIIPEEFNKPKIKQEIIEKGIAKALKAEHIPIVEMMVLDTPDEGMYVSFVNGLMTIDGGVHVQKAYQSISSHIIEEINQIMANKTKAKKGEEKSVTPRLTIEDVKQHVTIIINCRIGDPKYNSQSKTKLESPVPHISVDKKDLKLIKTWDLLERLQAAMDAKMMGKLKKSNGNRTKHIQLENGDDANNAGTSESNKCILYLVEGKSAASYPKKRIVNSPGGKNYGGWYPLRGKFLNVRNASVSTVAANKEVKAIKEMLGLREGVNYSLPENLLTMRYGYVLITVDADSDGFHIASLIINYFDKYYKGLLTSGKVGILRTPVVRIKDNHDNVVHRFFSNADFEAWSEKNIIDGQMPKGLKKPFYYKGLGTSEDKDIIEDISTAPVVTVVYDSEAAESLFKAFDKTMADKRKEWIGEWREVSQVEDVIFETVGEFKQQSITKFINRELINYSIDALFRAIPSFDDGLKRSQRQALYAGLVRFKYGRKNEPEKVARFAAFAANETNYHHGETSMCETIIKLAQDYIGANNLSLFNGVGQFGTRSEMGDDAASPRYISVNLPKYITHLYDEELISIIPKRIIDGEEAEPIYVPAVIPIHIVNGANGIATGYSTTIPNHNYYDVINWLKERCNLITKPNGGKNIEPWYRGFKGKIIMSGKEHEPRGEDETDDGPDNLESVLPKSSMPKINDKRYIVRGEYKITPVDRNSKVNIVVKEIPVGVSFVSYRAWLNTLLFNKQIDDLSDESVSLEEPHWVIKGMKVKSAASVNYKSLHLEDGFNMTNFNLIDTNGYPVKFEDTSSIMEKYYERMVELYQKVKNHRLKDIQSKMLDLSYRIHFIKAVVENKIVIFKRKKADIIADMKAYNPSIPEKYLSDVRAHEFTEEELNQSYVDYNKLKELFENTSLLTPQKLWLEKLEGLETYLKKNKY